MCVPRMLGASTHSCLTSLVLVWLEAGGEAGADLEIEFFNSDIDVVQDIHNIQRGPLLRDLKDHTDTTEDFVASVPILGLPIYKSIYINRL